jgi:adenylosuccinate synthase
MKQYNLKAVIGAGAGDEGKGNMTSYFCGVPGRTLGVLTNGGPQRGHTAACGKRRHVFSHFSSGTFKGARTYFAPSFMINPMQFSREYRQLTAMGAAPVFHMDRDCRFTTPYDMLVNQKVHQAQGTHGTCGMGIWETYKRYAGGEGLTVGAYMAMTEVQRYRYLDQIRAGALARLADMGTPEQMREALALAGDERLLVNFMEDLEDMAALTEEGGLCGPEILLSYDNVVFENGQGLILDWSDDEEKAVYTTPSRTGLAAVSSLVEQVFSGQSVEVCYVTRSYQTRHGDGPMDGECPREELGRGVRELTNQTNPFQGHFRFGRLEVEGLHERIRRDFGDRGSRNTYKKSIAVTHLDQMDMSEELMEETLLYGERYLVSRPDL